MGGFERYRFSTVGVGVSAKSVICWLSRFKSISSNSSSSGRWRSSTAPPEAGRMSIFSLSNFKAGVITLIGSGILTFPFSFNRTIAPEHALVETHPTFDHRVNVHQPLACDLPIAYGRMLHLLLRSGRGDYAPNQDRMGDGHAHSLHQ